MSKWIKKDDEIIVIAGNDKGRTGKVLRREENRVLVQGINMRKKHLKQRSEKVPSQILDIEVPIHISNVRLLSESKKKPVKLRVKEDKKGKHLYYREEEKEVIYRTLRKFAG